MPAMLHTRLLVLQLSAVCLVVVCIVGCGGTGGSVPVEGVVTLDGQPLVGAQISLFSGRGPDAEVFMGKTDDQGRYTLRRSGTDEPGASPGNYQVSFTTAVIEGYSDELTKAPPERVPSKYLGGRETFEVPDEGTTEADFHLTSR